MRQHQETLTIQSKGPGLHEITREIERVVQQSGLHTGMCHIFVRHTSASLLIQENADPEVRRDLERFFSRLSPDGDPLFQHTSEGEDDMPAHLRTVLTTVNLSIPIQHRRLALGTWQGIYLCEHRNHGGSRRIVVTVQGE